MVEEAAPPARVRFISSAMRPRRWYGNEVAPRKRRVKLTARTWRYQAVIRSRKVDAAPITGAASIFVL